jgi:hypothetical protein
MRRLVPRELRRPQERHLTPERPAGSGDRVVVGREDHAIECVRGACDVDRVRDERLAGERPEILARQSLRTPARRDDSEDSQLTRRPDAELIAFGFPRSTHRRYVMRTAENTM